MKQSNASTTAVAIDNRKHITTSPDGKWETFHKHTGLMRYVPSGIYFARFKINGTVKRESLETKDKVSALTLLAGVRETMIKPVPEKGTFEMGRLAFEHETNTKHELADRSRSYRLECLKIILESLPKVDTRRVDSITLQELEIWAKNLSAQYAPHTFNMCVFYLRQILGLAGLKREENPAYKIKRRGVPQKQLHLPSSDQFHQLLHVIQKPSKGLSQEDRNNLVNYLRFLAFTGCRWQEAAAAKWHHVNWKDFELTIVCAKRRATSSENRLRIIPMVPALRDLLQTMAKQPHTPDDPISPVKQCVRPLKRACKVVGIPPLSHHSFRHLYATFCIEAGVDIPTVSHWMGHSDGGALAMKVYGHLRREHSQRMAERITFGLPPVPMVPMVPALPEPKELETV